MGKQLFTYCFIFGSLLCNAQTGADSIRLAAFFDKADSNKIKARLQLADMYSFQNPDSAIYFSTLGKDLALKIKNTKFIASSYLELGWDNYVKGNYGEALKNYEKALKAHQKIKNRVGESTNLGYLAIVYREQGNYPKALAFYFKALKIAEELDDKNMMARHLGGIGAVYLNQKDYTNALKYCFKALEMKEKLPMKNGISVALGNIANIYRDKKESNKALEYYFKSLATDQALGNKNGMAISYGNIGNTYEDQGDSSIRANNKKFAFGIKFPLAMKYYAKAMEIDEEFGNKKEHARHLGNVGYLYLKKGEYAQSEKYLIKCLGICEEIGAMDHARDFEKILSELYEKTGNFSQAIEHYKKYVADRDSISNDENTKAQARTEMQYEFDKQQTADSIQTAERANQEQLKHEQEIAQQKMYTYGGIIGFGLMLIVAFVSLKAFRNKQKANLVIAHQKELVEEKQKEILDSILYARRIQRALLPSEKYISKHLDKLK